MSTRFTTEQFIEKANIVHGGKYDYSHTVYVDSRTNLDVICPEHGVFTQRASSHLQGSGCPMCAKQWTDEHRQNLQMSSRKSRGMTTDEWIERAKCVHGDKYDYSQTVYVNQRTNVKIICPVHGLFEQKADSHIRGNGCRLCGLLSEKRKGVHNWSVEQRQKTAMTCLKRYGASRYLDSDAGRADIARIKSNPLFKQRMSDIISSDTVQDKTKQTCLTKYGVEHPMQSKSVLDRNFDAKRKNGTWKTSKPEKLMYQMLCDKFGAQDVECQYKDFRYPFHCDFYIKSIDTFIELNATWLHGHHWFVSNDANDMAMLNSWLDKAHAGHKFYQVAIDVWTVRDVKKRQTAIENNLNYLVFWDEDLSDFKEWLESDVIVLNNTF